MIGRTADMLNKVQVLERIQTLSDVIDERYNSVSVAQAKKLEELIEEAFVMVCRRDKR